MMIGGTVESVLKQKRTDLWSVPPETKVFDAIKMMAEKNIGALLVIEGKTVIGIATERDYARKVVLIGKSSRETPVREILSLPMVKAKPSNSVDECLRLMTEQRVRHLPIMDGEVIVGVVSIGDLVNWVISAQDVTIKQMENYIAGNYFG